jgi:hypothetical protein
VTTLSLLAFFTLTPKVFTLWDTSHSSPRFSPPNWSLCSPFLRTKSTSPGQDEYLSPRGSCYWALFTPLMKAFFLLPSLHSWTVSAERCEQSEEAKAIWRTLPTGWIMHQCGPSPTQVSRVPPGTIPEV